MRKIDSRVIVLAIIVFISTIVLIVINPVGIVDPSFFGLTVIIIIIMFWQGLRDNPEPKILHGIDLFLQSVRFDEYPARSIGNIKVTIRPFKSYDFKFKVYDHIPAVSVHAHFDVGNDGLRDVTIHECRLYMEYPERKELPPIMFHEEGDVERAREEGRPPKRKLLRRGERVTESFKLEGGGLYRLELYTTRLEDRRWLVYLRKGRWIAFCDTEKGIDRDRIHKIERVSEIVSGIIG